VDRSQSAKLIVAVAVLLLAAAVPASGQTLPAAQGALPRMWDGKPDLNGVWQALTTADWDLQDHSARLGVPAGQGVVEGNDIPYQPWAVAKKQENFKNRATADPEEKCFLLGVPRTMYAPFPFQIVHSPDYIAVLSEYAHTTRSIFMNSEHPPGPIEWFMGDSRGRWEGDTLVVDVKYFTDQTWLGPRRQLPQRGSARRRALHDGHARSHSVRSDARGWEGVHATVEDQSGAVPSQGTERARAGVRVLRVRGAGGCEKTLNANAQGAMPNAQ
jgi:hypothetical protein